MVLFVAYLGDYEKCIVGAFSSFEKAKESVKDMKDVHIEALAINTFSKKCNCLLCQPIGDNADGLNELWISYTDWDGWNDRPDFTVGIKQINDYDCDNMDNIGHVVKVQLDVALVHPKKCSCCMNCVDKQNRYEQSVTIKIKMAQQELSRAQEHVERCSNMAGISV
jgi:hypothetical protein